MKLKDGDLDHSATLAGFMFKLIFFYFKVSQNIEADQKHLKGMRDLLEARLKVNFHFQILDDLQNPNLSGDLKTDPLKTGNI